MNVSTTSEADVVCKDLIGEAYEATYERPDLDALWINVEDALKFDFGTTREEDRKGMAILEEVFEEACLDHPPHVAPGLASEDVDYQRLWERLCEVLGVRA